MQPAASKNHTSAAMVLIVTLVLFALAMGRVLTTRYDTGEQYSEYSSMRADPLGTRALFEALGDMPGVTVERQFRRLDRLQGATGETLIVAGLGPRGFTSAGYVESQGLARFAASGGRLVIALNPGADLSRISRAYRDAQDELEEKERREQKPSKKEPKKSTEPPSGPKKEDKDNKNEKIKVVADSMASLSSVLKISPNSREYFYREKEGASLTASASSGLTDGDLPPWFSNSFLDDTPDQDWNAQSFTKSLKPDGDPNQKKKPSEPSPWHVIALNGERQVIMERQLGSGTVVVCTDRYFLSNEALWKHPSPRFLGWLLGDASKVIFEETHLGLSVGEEDGIMTLARRYRMHGLFLGGILLFALFIWRNASSLVPADPDEDGLPQARAISGQSTTSGLESLLRRGITPSQLLARCFELWTSTKSCAASVPEQRRAKARTALDMLKSWRHAPQAYSQIRDALHTRRKPSSPTQS